MNDLAVGKKDVGGLALMQQRKTRGTHFLTVDLNQVGETHVFQIALQRHFRLRGK
jgi:hypothetical protein